MSEHRWSLIFRTISNGNIGSAPSIMLNAVSMKIKTPVRPTPALEKKEKKIEFNPAIVLWRSRNLLNMTLYTSFTMPAGHKTVSLFLDEIDEMR